MESNIVTITAASVLPGPESKLQLQFSDATAACFNRFWLRDNCPSGFHPQTGERAFDLLSVPDDLSIASAELQSDGRLRLRWLPDQHVSQFDAGWLYLHRPGQRRPDPARVDLVLWQRADLPDGPPRHHAGAILRDDAALLAWLRDCAAYGVTVVDGIEGGGEASIALARRIGFLRETNFGLTFEVINKPDPNNLAYTSLALALHSDLPNQETPPGFQFLHCIANDAEGGGSIFGDGYAIAQALRSQDPKAFDTLCEVAVPYRFFDREADIRIRRPVITLREDGSVSELRYNAHIADLIDLPEGEVDAWYRSYRSLMRITRDPAYRLTFKMTGGEMVAFDNRRVLHGREAFNPATGKRHLHGCYVDRGEFLSRLRMLQPLA